MEMICKKCGVQGKPKHKKKDNWGGVIAFILLVMLSFAIPVLWILVAIVIIGSVIKLFADRGEKCCSSCGSFDVVDIDSPMGQKTLKDLKQK